MGFLESLKTSWKRGGVRAGRGKYFIATGRVVRLGNRVAVAHTEMVNDAGELIATGGAAHMSSSS